MRKKIAVGVLAVSLIAVLIMLAGLIVVQPLREAASANDLLVVIIVTATDVDDLSGLPATQGSAGGFELRTVRKATGASANSGLHRLRARSQSRAPSGLRLGRRRASGLASAKVGTARRIAEPKSVRKRIVINSTPNPTLRAVAAAHLPDRRLQSEL